jgi:hypothetical protein
VSSDIPWPYHIEDRAKAIHFALDPDCGYANPLNCMNISHRTILATLREYDKWVGYQDGRGES